MGSDWNIVGAGILVGVAVLSRNLGEMESCVDLTLVYLIICIKF